MNKNYLLLILLAVGFIFMPLQKEANAATCACIYCAVLVAACSTTCGTCSISQQIGTEAQFELEMTNHKRWMVDIFWQDNEEGSPPGLAHAMMLMAEQLTVNALQQVFIIGTFFDAKHQLETQQLFQTLTARAHKDYHPSAELCEIGTITRPLAASERISNLVSTAVSKRSVDRQLLSVNTLEMKDGIATDQRSRLVQFIKTYCNPADNSQNLSLLCLKGGGELEDINKDIDYTSTIDLPLTLDIDLSDPAISNHERDLFALTANLISHETMPVVSTESFKSKDVNVPSFSTAAVTYLNSRALVAKRSVAANSIASIAALKASGSPDSKPFIYSLIHELSPGYFDEEAIEKLIGENPSYYAQMEILTKKIYQDPNFYSDLYDKPANVLRKDVAIQAAELMQKRDIYRSILRSEAVLAVTLETALLEIQDKFANELKQGKESKTEGN